MERRVFGFDIDGVLTADDNGKTNLWMDEACRFFNKDLVKPSFYLHEALGVSPQAIEKFFAARGEDILRQVPLRDGCRQVLTDLKTSGARIILITARRQSYQSITQEWLSGHQIPYDALIMHPDNSHWFSKGTKCRQLGVEFFVDDNFENCLDIEKAGVYTLMYHTSHNKDQSAPIPRVYSWREIAKYIAAFLG